MYVSTTAIAAAARGVQYSLPNHRCEQENGKRTAEKRIILEKEMPWRSGHSSYGYFD